MAVDGATVGRGAEPVQSSEAGRPDREAVAAPDQVQAAALCHAQAARQDGTVARRRRTEERHHRHGNHQIRFIRHKCSAQDDVH